MNATLYISIVGSPALAAETHQSADCGFLPDPRKPV